MDAFAELIGDSRRIRALRTRLKQLVRGSAGRRRPPPVLIQGETGTGKGLVAKMLHRAGARAGGPFVDINCASIPGALLEAELFGYERGAFTAARRAKPGMFLLAHRGTIFLDEVALLSVEAQAKLLKVLEDRTVRRLGATREEPVDVWILSATSDNMTASVRERRFREDLYHRLGVVTVAVPPLRERRGDIVRLAEHFLDRACADYGLTPRRLSAAARDRLVEYAWSGNVRELANVIERATVLSDSAEITAEALGLGTARPVRLGRSHPPSKPARGSPRRGAQESGPGPPLRALVPAGPAAPSALVPPDSFRWERRFVASVRVSLGQTGANTRSAASRVLDLAVDKILGFGGRIEALGPGALEASFGVTAVDEAPRLAGHAALAIQAGVERMRQRNQGWEAPGIVIHTDHALVGRLGGGMAHMDLDSRDRFAASVDPLVALVGSGEILVTAAAAPLMGRRFALEEGRPDDAAIPRHHRLLGRAPDALGGWGQGASFVGRAREMERLLSHAATALRGEGQVVGVVGEPGVGKSRLIREFLRRMEDRPWRVLEATCDGGGRALYHLAAGLLRSYFGVRSRDPAERVRAVIAEVLAARAPDLESVRVPVETLLGVPSVDAQWHDLDPDERRQRMYEAVARLLVLESARSPLLIALEDAHWIDAESQALLDHLVAAMIDVPVLAVVSYRPEYHPRWAERSPGQLRLEPLPDRIATELLDELTGRDDSLLPLKRQLVEWTGGNPFFLEESVRSLVEGGVLAGARGGYVLTREVARIEVPATVEGILAVRIDRLSVTDRHIAQIAAVIGSQIPSRLLAAVAVVSNVSADELAAALIRLREAELLCERTVGGEIDLVFKHALTHEVARLGVPPVARKGLHRAILQEVERLDGDAADERVDLLAHHAVGGELWDKAVVYLNQAGQRALGSAAMHKAAECFEGALSALEHLPDAPSRWGSAINVHLNLRDVLWPLARMPEVLAHLREADALAERVGDVRRQGWAACYLCQYFWAMGDHEQALQGGDRALAIARKLGDLALAAVGGHYLGIALMALGRFADAERALLLSVEEVEAALAGTHPFPSRRFGRNGPAIVRGFLSAILGELGRFADGHRHGHAAVRLAEAIDSPFALVAAMTGLGSLYIRKVEPRHAIPVLERALALCRAHRLHNWFSNTAASLGRAYLDAGRIAEGVALLEESARFVERTDVVVNRSRWLSYLAEGYLASGRLTQAQDVAERALEVARSSKERGNAAWALHVLGEILARTGPGQDDEALSLTCQALTLAEVQGQRPLEVRCHQALGVVLASRDPAAAARHRTRAAAIAADIGLAAPPI